MPVATLHNENTVSVSKPNKVKYLTIEQRNAQFESCATSAEKRVMLAQDVIAAIEAKRFKAVANTGYCRLKMRSNRDFEATSESYQLHKLLEGKIPKAKVASCTVCGIGSFFVAKVLRTNHFTVSTGDIGYAVRTNPEYITTISDEDMLPSLHHCFSDRQLRIIEAYFEGSFCHDIEGVLKPTSTQGDKVRNFVDKYPKAEDRLIAICELIIKGKGEVKYW